ncbi:hypothetical protein WH95_06250 [Kiloniella litopenaei]|uniref:Uncharacterized protein n=1 Tax=Kiloniella litopenaei TaxID=1549748 RepID=A0A0M2R7V3_9PROT|nr:hypothetical protein [Kiloniella litopenaei]KKJ78002.1 hypothetical protein WH95_06250 [Kiloniella litopenaei]
MMSNTTMARFYLHLMLVFGVVCFDMGEEGMSKENTEPVRIAYPEWTEYRKKNGLDPLGMQNSSVSLYQTFLPGISNVTLRMRYYGLYAWLAQRYAKEVSDTDLQNWKRYVRRAEALYALVASHHTGETGIAGIEWATSALSEQQGDSIEFAEAAEPGSENYYLKQVWGAFGAAYRSQLFEIGIFDSSHIHEIPLPSRPLGEGLAEAFADAAGPLADLYFNIVERGVATIAELDELAPLLPSVISPDSTEQKYYREILVTQKNAPTAGALSRKLSVQLILKVATLLGREPHPDEIRWVLYAGCDQNGEPLVLNNPALEAQRLRWWVYQANDLCHVAHEVLLKFTLDILGDHRAGIGLANLVGQCTEKILDEFEDHPKSWDTLVSAIELENNAFDSLKVGAEITLASNIIRAGRDDATVCTSETAAKALHLLAILHRRIRDTNTDLYESLGGFNTDAFRSLLSETRFLDSQKEEPFRKTIERIIEERIIRRHLWIALRKLRHQGDYTFLIEADNGRLRLREKDGPVFTNPRLGPAITFLKDVGMLGDDGLTSQGAEAVSV